MRGEGCLVLPSVKELGHVVGGVGSRCDLVGVLACQFYIDRGLNVLCSHALRRKRFASA